MELLMFESLFLYLFRACESWSPSMLIEQNLNFHSDFPRLCPLSIWQLSSHSAQECSLGLVAPSSH